MPIPNDLRSVSVIEGKNSTQYFGSTNLGISSSGIPKDNMICHWYFMPPVFAATLECLIFEFCASMAGKFGGQTNFLIFFFQFVGRCLDRHTSAVKCKWKQDAFALHTLKSGCKFC